MKKIDAVLKNIVICLIMLSICSCEQDQIASSPKLTKVDKTIYEYLKSNPSYTILVEALDITQLSGKLNLYGNMTMFAPSNDAFMKLFVHKGISGLSKMNIDTLSKMLKYHIYTDKFNSVSFQTGSLPAVTISGDLIKMDISKGLKNTYLNDAVKVDSLDIEAINGVVHVIGDVLEPPSKTIYSRLVDNLQFSIMAEAVKMTGMDTAVLNKVVYDNNLIINGLPSKKWVTVFFEPNNVLNQNGIYSFDDLAKKYSNTYYTTKNYTNPSDSLNIFIRYHCMQRKVFMSDIRSDYMESLSASNWLIFDTKGSMNINKHDERKIVFNSLTGKNDTIITQVMVNINPDKSNQVASNGIIHSVESVLSVYNPKPVIVKCYFAGAPEDRAITLLDGKVSTLSDEFKNLNNNPVGQSVVWWLKWGYDSGTPYIFCSWPT